MKILEEILIGIFRVLLLLFAIPYVICGFAQYVFRNILVFLSNRIYPDSKDQYVPLFYFIIDDI